MKRTIYNSIISCFLIMLAVMVASPLYGQEKKEKKPDRPVRDVFQSNLLIDNQTVIVPFKGTFEMDIIHRFGTWNRGYDDFWGIFAPANLRLGFTYVPIDKLQVGFGLVKENLLYDFNIKYAILKQTRSDRMPLNLTYYGNVAIDSRDGANFINSTDRYSYFHQLMLARKFSDRFSLQASFNLSHFNAVEAFLNENNEELPKMENDHYSFTVLGRIKATEGLTIIFNYDQPITSHEMIDPESNISFGVEMATSAHAFQIFIGNYKSIVPQYNNVFNRNGFGDNEILIGFNITRLWSF